MGSRTWIKIYCDKWLSGTLREEKPEIRSVWIDLLTLAGSGRYGDIGEIKIMNDVPLTDEQIAQVLRISLKLWQKAKVRFIDTDRIKVTADNIISITNWGKYQSEYERQKVYRPESYKQKLQAEVTVEKEKGEGRGEKRDRREENNIYTLYEQNIGELTPMVSEELRAAEKLFPVEWIVEAIREAVTRGKRSWKYIAAILENRSLSGPKGKDDPYKYIGQKHDHMVNR